MNVPDKGFNSFYTCFEIISIAEFNVPLKSINFVNLWR